MLNGPIRPIQARAGIAMGREVFQHSSVVQVAATTVATVSFALVTWFFVSGPELDPWLFRFVDIGNNVWLEPVFGVGLCAVVLRQIDQGSTSVGTVFTLLRRSPAVIVMGAGLALVQDWPFYLLEYDESGSLSMPDLAAFFGSLVYMCAVNVLFIWSYPAFADGHGPIESLRLSLRLTRENVLGSVGVALLFYLFLFVGAIACGIGVVLTLPMATSMVVATYRTAFRTETARLEAVFD